MRRDRSGAIGQGPAPRAVVRPREVASALRLLHAKPKPPDRAAAGPWLERTRRQLRTQLPRAMSMRRRKPPPEDGLEQLRGDARLGQLHRESNVPTVPEM